VRLKLGNVPLFTQVPGKTNSRKFANDSSPIHRHLLESGGGRGLCCCTSETAEGAQLTPAWWPLPPLQELYRRLRASSRCTQPSTSALFTQVPSR
jgi:hypothetical protein